MRGLTDTSKLYVVIGTFALCLGGFSYFAKTTSHLQSAQIESLEKQIDDEDYFVKLPGSHHKVRIKRPRFAKDGSIINETSTSEAASTYSTSYNERVKNHLASNKIKDKKTGKLVKKLDKNKKAKKDKDKKIAKKNSQPSDDVDYDNDNNYSDNNDIYAFGNNQAQPKSEKTSSQKKKEEEENLDSFDYWAQPIFDQQDFAAVGKLVKSYQSKKVSSGVFYNVVTKMNQNEHYDVRGWGTLALGETPSTNSFSKLTWVKYNEPTEEIKNTATDYIDSYSQSTKKIPYLLGALQAEDTQINMEALKAISKSSEYLGESATGKNGTTPTEIEPSELASQMTAAVQQIEANQMQSSDPAVKAQAVETINLIRRYLKVDTLSQL